MATPGTSHSTEWRSWTLCDVNSKLSNPVQCVRFDPFEELVWTGTSNGKVASFLPVNSRRYTAFVATKDGPVNAVEATHNMIFSLCKTELRMNTRQGLPCGRFSSPSMENMVSLYAIPNSSAFLMGGRQDKLIHYDFVHDKEIRTTEIQESGAMVIRGNGAVVFTADHMGNIHQRSATTMEHIHTFACHTDRILDFDVQGNKLVTCGVNKNKGPDQFVKVYDIRAQKFLHPLAIIQQPPRYVRFVPAYTERLVVISQQDNAPGTGKEWPVRASMRVFDMNSPHATMFHSVIETSYIDGFDISSNKGVMAIGNGSGHIQLFTNRDHPLINDNSEKTVFHQPPAQPPCSFSIDDTSQTFGQILMPFSPEPLLSDWEMEYTGIVFRRFKPLLPKIDSKQVHYTVQIQNHRSKRRLEKHNVCPYFLSDPDYFQSDEEEEEVVEAPKAEEEAQESKEIEESKESTAPGPPSEETIITRPSSSDSSHGKIGGKIRISKLYGKSKLPKQPGPLTFPQRISQLPEDVLWNLHNHVIMESSFDMNLLANPLVHVLYSLSPFKTLIMGHICQEDNCLTCELHFLFTAFDTTGNAQKSKPRPQFTTTNLAWTLARKGISLATCQNKFHVLQGILELVAREIFPKENPTFQHRLRRFYKCTRCGKTQKTTQEEGQTVLDFDYTGVGTKETSFTRMLERAIHLRSGTREKKECEECQVETPMKCSRQIDQLSPLLIINANPTHDGYMDFWRRNLQKTEQKPRGSDEEKPEKTGEFSKQCRFGSGCHTRKCKFAHGHNDFAAEQAELMRYVDFPGWSHYLPKMIAVQIYDKKARISDVSTLPLYDEVTAEVYELEAIVDMISNGATTSPTWTHPVTLLREPQLSSTSWTMINELIVSRLHDHEARRCDAQWKLPVMFVYKKRGFEQKVEVEEKVPEEWFFAEKNLGEKGAESLAIRDIAELPGKEEIVGIDCEFIQVKTNLLDFNGGLVEIKEIGRASCVNRSGDKIIFDDHVSLAEGFEVQDYLTKYSGIVADHLNPTASDKYLTSHKRLLLRMHVLVQRGVIFVGHALHNDFTVLNVHIPETQIIDTVQLLRSEERLLSLAFITKHLLGEEIQVNTHDSVIDAQYALKIYEKYLEMKNSGTLADEQRRLHAIMMHEHVSRGSPLCVSTKRNRKEESDTSNGPNSY